MAIKLFGYSFGKSNEAEELKSVVVSAEDENDGSIVLNAGYGAIGHYIDMEGIAKDENDLIHKYREVAITMEVDNAVDDIVNESIVANENKPPVSINTDDLGVSEVINKKIREEFKTVIRLLNFNTRAHDIFRRWYVDGRLYFHKVIDEKNPKQGIKELRPIDPRAMKKIKLVVKEKDEETKADLVQATVEYYLFTPGAVNSYKGSGSGTNTAGVTNSQETVTMSKDSVTFVHSGLADERGRTIGYLHKALKPLNNLRMIEDAIVIYRISRAPERRIFYIDVGNLPKNKAEQYLKSVMTRYKNKITYNSTTGEMNDERRWQSMMEDFWLPRREGGRGTEVSTLPGGANLGELEDVKYFQNKLDRALHVPPSRRDSESGGGGFQLGKNAEINRDELKFNKFANRLRNRFNHLFHDLLKTQLIHKGIITEDDWELFREHINYDYIKDAHFSELKDLEVMVTRIDTLSQAEPFIGTYFSEQQAKKIFLHQTDEEIEQIQDQITNENEAKKKTGDGDFSDDDDV